MNYNWDWGVIFQLSPTGEGSYLDLLINGTMWTLVTSVSSWILALSVGIVIGIMRAYPSKVARAFSRGYVELFRNIPLLVQLFLWYFVVPEFLPNDFGRVIKQSQDAPFYTAVIGIGFYMSARIAELVKGGIQALPTGQYQAGLALGLKPFECFRYVLIPMALRIILPPMTNDMMNTVKCTSVALTIGLMELTAQSRATAEFSFQIFEAFSIAIAVYVIINYIIVFVMSRLERKLYIPGSMGAK
ncbi:Glutamine transport system permease protein GlnP [Pseudomonas sp. AD21]|uniref:amino acid ABC transporter permease n=1 Tax=Pseudomonas sp. AD21 TaxID=396378 RepID=UPI000C860943|nr:amino acid ABC transporter permease [Pseudomonas sp. AD21]PMQ11567.1 Glutamine transport system permease protein GlnP [Pseudomonas sp. AD21]